MSADLRSQIDYAGFAVVPDVIDNEIVSQLRELVDAARQRNNSENVANSSGTYGLRNLIDVLPEVINLVRHPGVTRLVSVILGSEPFLTRSTLFDKTPGANWGVFWHQDLSIAVEEKLPMDGFTAWTRKAGVACVQPPVSYMERILAVRIHLDDCNAENGALKVLPGTHRMSKLSMAEVELQQQAIGEVVCTVPAGGVVLMRPLLLHASSPMEQGSNRRVIHLEFANFDLPGPLNWKYRILCES